MIQIAALVVIGLVVLKFASQLIAKLFGLILIVLAVVIIMFHQGLGPFEENTVSLDYLEQEYCPEETNKCDCVVEIIKEDMDKRFSDLELAELKENRIKEAYALKRSYEKNKEKIGICFAERGATDEIKEVLEDVLPYEQAWVEKLKSALEWALSKADEHYEKIKEEKKTIDEKYT